MTGIRRTSVLNGDLLIELTTGTQLLINKAVLDTITDEQVASAILTFRTNNNVPPCGLIRDGGTVIVWTGVPPV